MTNYPAKVQFNFKIHLESIKPYYNLAERWSNSTQKIDEILNIDYDFAALGADYEIYLLAAKYFASQRSNEYSDEELTAIYNLSQEAFAIAYLFCENEWQTYYRYIYKSYQVDTKKQTKSENFISKEFIELQDILRLYRMTNNIESTDIRLRQKINGNIDKNQTIELESEDRSFIIESLLNNKLDGWYNKQLTNAEISVFKQSIGKKFEYNENLPIANIIDKMNNITSQGIMYLLDIHKKANDSSLQYLTDLYECIKQNWSWDTRKSPLNTFNSLIVKTLDRYIDDKAIEHKDIFIIGSRKYKEQFMFSILRVLNLIPKNESYEVSKPFDAKEDYIKDLLKK